MIKKLLKWGAKYFHLFLSSDSIPKLNVVKRFLIVSVLMTSSHPISWISILNSRAESTRWNLFSRVLAITYQIKLAFTLELCFFLSPSLFNLWGPYRCLTEFSPNSLWEMVKRTERRECILIPRVKELKESLSCRVFKLRRMPFCLLNCV